ncbi:hypothetical protein LDENG_00247550 [Lucifuga dentata]|nr:hypothetical protein LDENG_00247550 [Lucifuga dentata]
MHYLHLKDLLASYNIMIKDARAAYFSQLITKSKGNPRVLFNTINRIVSLTVPFIPGFSSSDCDRFLSHFVAKVMDIFSGIVSFPNYSTNDFLHQPLLLDHFAPFASFCLPSESPQYSSQYALLNMSPRHITHFFPEKYISCHWFMFSFHYQ